MENGKIGFIGIGNMASAIIGGILSTNALSLDQICMYNPHPEKMQRFAEAGCVPCGSIAALSEKCSVIFLCIKPQVFPEVLRELKPAVANKKESDVLFVSIAAGVTLARLEGLLGSARKIVRVMPNLALAVGYGAAGVAPGATACDRDVQDVIAIFSPGGAAVAVTEAQIDDVAALSGSGAAYIYYMVENLRDAAIEAGIAPDTAAMLAKQTLLGAAKQLELEDEPPEELRRRITSKKGTTEAAINALDEHGFPEAVRACYNANKRRSRELAE